MDQVAQRGDGEESGNGVMGGELITQIQCEREALILPLPQVMPPPLTELTQPLRDCPRPGRSRIRVPVPAVLRDFGQVTRPL